MMSRPARGYALSFAEGVTVGAVQAHGAVIQMPATCKSVVLEDLSPGLREAVDILASTGATEEELASRVEGADGPGALTRLYYYLLNFAEERILRYSVCFGALRCATLSPSSALFRFSPVPVDPGAEYVLSRFAFIRREGRKMVMESPLAHGAVTLHLPEALAIAAGLAEPRTLSSLCGLVPAVPSHEMELLLAMLRGAGFACEVDPHGAYPEERGALVQWEFHDLLFHARSRLGRHANPYGATYRFHTKIDPQPVVKPALTGDTIPLYRPDMDLLREEDLPFTLVLEERRSIREYGKEPVTDRQLGEFLFRTARVKGRMKREYEDVSRRPYPGAGAAYELELYLAVHACRGMPPGFYHYCPERHVLERMSDLTEDVAALLTDARGAAGLEETPQALVIIAARLQRISWKYESIAYSLMLKDVGVLFQTMYLVATAMDLAPCALGGGDSDLFARTAGLDYYTETSVGEFLIGSKRM